MVLFYETEQINSLFFLHLLHTSEQLCNISIQVHKRSEVENGFFHRSSTSHNLCSSIHPLRKEQPGDAAEGAQPQTVQLQGGLDALGGKPDGTSWTRPQEKTSWTRPPGPDLLDEAIEHVRSREVSRSCWNVLSVLLFFANVASDAT